jgi:pimeloyl-ACP methyl ester carboxylesterase
VTNYVEAADGRRLAVNWSGDTGGEPVFFLHGTPGSRLSLPQKELLKKLGVWLISFDRPGYGRSDRLEARTVADVAPDVKAIANWLGLEQFAVLGRSGGGPHALACAALLPDRVTRAAALVSLAPMKVPGLHWFRGMAESNVTAYSIAADGKLTELRNLLTGYADEIATDPGSHLAVLSPEMPEADRQVISDSEVRKRLEHNFSEALRNSVDGWIDDVLAFCSPWDFDLSGIEVPVLLWHGNRDVFSPVAHTQWLGRRIRGARVKIQPDHAHFGALEAVEDALSWLSRSHPDPVLWGSPTRKPVLAR